MSTLNVNTLAEATAGGATYFTAKAWVNFDSLSTLSITDSGNVSSVTDNSTGNYTINFDNTLSTAGYSLSGFGVAYTVTNVVGAALVTLAPTGTNTKIPVLKSTSAVNIVAGNSYNGGVQDAGDYSLAVVA